MATIIDRAAVLAAILSLAACAMDHANPERPAQPSEAPSACNAQSAGFARGEVYTDELAQRARKSSGAKTVRALRPGQVVTMEYREDRLNLEVDESGRVKDVRCG